MTSLFQEATKTELISKPAKYYKKCKINKLSEQVERKELLKQKKEELSPEEYKKRYRIARYHKDKHKTGKIKKEKNKQEVANMKQLYEDTHKNEVSIINRDDYYTKKYRDDDTVCNAYNFSWRSSRLIRISRKQTPKWKAPFRISKRHAMITGINRLFNTQVEAYKYLKPHIDEIKNCKYALAKKQYIYSPLYYMDEPMRTIIEQAPVPNHRAIYVADGMIRGKFMVSELYLGRDSFIFGDVLVTQTGNTFRIALENNLSWLTKDTVEEIHSLRMDWRKNKGEKAPPIYIVNDAYLIQIPINEQEILYYIVPT